MRRIRHACYMGRNRIVVLVASCLAVAGIAALGAQAVTGRQATLNLSTAGPAPTTATTDATESTATTATTGGEWMAELEPPTTIAHAPRTVTTTTTVPVVITTTTTTAPVTTTTVADQRAVIDSVTNHYSFAMSLTIHSINQVSWTIAPGETQSGATFQIGGPTSDGGSSHVVQQPSCGSGDSAQYFTAGHHYVVEVVLNGIPDGCNTIPGYFVLMRDVATGESQHII